MELTAKQKANLWSMSLQGVSRVCGNKQDGKPVLNLVTLRNWHKNKPAVFDCAVIGASVIAHNLENDVLKLIENKGAQK